MEILDDEICRAGAGFFGNGIVSCCHGLPERSVAALLGGCERTGFSFLIDG
jgi:hypothetical protein